MKNGLFLNITNILSIINTKLFWHRCRIVRVPIFIRNRKNMLIGKGFTTGVNCRLYCGDQGLLKIGNNVTIGDNVQIQAIEKITIGNDVLIASKVYIGDAVHGKYKGDNQISPYIPPNQRPVSSLPIIIGNRVWIGNNVSVLPGIKIGSGSVVSAGSVVTKDVPENSVIAGIPAQIIKKWDTELEKWIKI